MRLQRSPTQVPMKVKWRSQRTSSAKSLGLSVQTVAYSPAGMTDDVIRMETGLPDKVMFRRVLGLVQRFEGSTVHATGWRVEGMTMESQVFMALTNVRQNYTHLHLAQLFSCSTATVGNVAKTLSICYITYCSGP